MPRILLIGLDPDLLPPELLAADLKGQGQACGPDQMRQGVRRSLRDMQERGWSAVHCAVRPDETAGACVEHVLAQGTYDCVVITPALRMSRSLAWVFEAVINAVHRRAPRAAIAFGSRADDSADVAARWLAA